MYGLVFALLLLLAKRFQPLDKNSKHQAWFNRVIAAVITLLAAGGVAVSFCSGCIIFVASDNNVYVRTASQQTSVYFSSLLETFILGIPQTENFVPQQRSVQPNARPHVVYSSKLTFSALFIKKF